MKPDTIAVSALSIALVIGALGVAAGNDGALVAFVAGLGGLLGAYLGVKKNV